MPSTRWALGGALGGAWHWAQPHRKTHVRRGLRLPTLWPATAALPDQRSHQQANKSCTQEVCSGIAAPARQLCCERVPHEVLPHPTHPASPSLLVYVKVTDLPSAEGLDFQVCLLQRT